MNRTIQSALAITAVAVAAIGAALLSPRSAWAAGDITVAPETFVGAATRADVRAALFKSSWRLRGDALWAESPRMVSALTPAAARDEYKASRDVVKGMTGEDSGSSYMKLHPRNADPTTQMGGPPESAAPAEGAPGSGSTTPDRVRPD